MSSRNNFLLYIFFECLLKRILGIFVLVRVLFNCIICFILFFFVLFFSFFVLYFVYVLFNDSNIFRRNGVYVF